MAFNNNNNEEKRYEEVYSPLNLYSPDRSKVLGFDFVLQGILRMKITPRNGNGVGYDNSKSVSIYLSVNQAVVLSQALSMLREKIRNNQACNIGCTNNKKMANVVFESIPDSSGLAKIICSINTFNNGAIAKTATIEFKNDEYIVQDFDANTMNHTTVNMSDVPVVLIQNLLNEYVKAMTGAAAYGVHYCVGQYKYDKRKIKESLLGGGQKQLGNSQQQNNNSIFNQDKPSSNEFVSTNDSFDEFFD